MAKEIKFNIEARDSLKKGVDALSNAVKLLSLHTIVPGTVLFEPELIPILVASSVSPSTFMSLPPELIIAKPKGHNL